MFFKTIVFILIAIVVTGCAGGHIGVAPNGRAYGQMSIPPVQGYGYAPQQRQMMVQQNQTVIVSQQGYRNPSFRANYHNSYHGHSAQSRGNPPVQQCKFNPMTGQRVCQIIPAYMVNRW